MTMLLLMSPMFLGSSGVMVDVPVSEFQMERFDESIVVTLGPGGEQGKLYLGRTAIKLEDLPDLLEELRADEARARTIILLKSDVGTSVGMERKVSEIILRSGFKMALVGKSATPPSGVSERGGEP
ncbi:MAG: hypothetical protein NWT08_07445 [Akkermansiaceae bacterium]|nr:hypothetical protein [Akkermansiaceae bacterium]